MKVLCEGDAFIHCSRCGCLFQWDKGDIRHRDHTLFGMRVSTDDVVSCPQCGRIYPIR